MIQNSYRTRTDHNKSARHVNNNTGDKMSLYTSIGQVQKVLLNVSGVVKVKHFSKVNDFSGKIYFNKYYQQSLGYNNSTKRVELNALQYRTLQYCNSPELF